MLPPVAVLQLSGVSCGAVLLRTVLETYYSWKSMEDLPGRTPRNRLEPTYQAVGWSTIGEVA